ncbi:transcriptional regulator, AraC family domain protein [Burkholderia thailandensis]|nr:transcriptional regulator, AraC family domain protein [Burkholderia thailandensis]
MSRHWISRGSGAGPRALRTAFWRSAAAAADGSILVVRIFSRLMNSDAFFPFSDMFVTFEQVTGRAFSRRRHRHGAAAALALRSRSRLRCGAAKGDRQEAPPI